MIYGMIKYFGLPCGIIMVMLSAQAAFAEDSFNMVGSSTVYPFEKEVVTKLLEEKKIEAPHLEVTGTGKGIKKLCDTSQSMLPDLAGASRRIKKNELKACLSRDVHLIEMVFGLDAVVIAEDKNAEKIDLTRKDLFLALAAEVPSGDKLIPNPYHFWDEISATFPHRRIAIWGPPKSSGTREILAKHVLEYISEGLPIYASSGRKSYDVIRKDGVFHDDHEDHERAIRELKKDNQALGIFGFAYYKEHQDTLTAQDLDGFSPHSVVDIQQLHYPLARLLYIYINHASIDKNKDVQAFVEDMISPDISGVGGVLPEDLGLVPLAPSMLNIQPFVLKHGLELTPSMIK